MNRCSYINNHSNNNKSKIKIAAFLSKHLIHEKANIVARHYNIK